MYAPLCLHLTQSLDVRNSILPYTFKVKCTTVAGMWVMLDRSQTKTPSPFRPPTTPPPRFFLLSGHERRRFFQFLFNEFTRLHLENWITRCRLGRSEVRVWHSKDNSSTAYPTCCLCFQQCWWVQLLSTYKSGSCLKFFVL
jgi:hypothetical protein